MMAQAGNTGLLISLATGYLVCYLANKEKGALKTLGYLIGGFIILLSSLFIITHLCFSSRFLCLKGGMGMKMPYHHLPQSSGEFQK